MTPADFANKWIGSTLNERAAAQAHFDEIKTVDQVSRLGWSQVEPAIFGTLFEWSLDPSKRSQLGAHYSDRGSIMRLIEPVLMVPLRRDFEATKERITQLLAEGITPGRIPSPELVKTREALLALPVSLVAPGRPLRLALDGL